MSNIKIHKQLPNCKCRECGKEFYTHTKTNRDRSHWESMLHVIINEIYSGKSYYTKDEWNAINGGH